MNFIDAMWPEGFRCDRCGSTEEPELRQRQARGFEVKCRCGSVRTFECKKIRLLRKVPGAIDICACVCVVYHVSLRDVLYPRQRLNGKMPAYRAKKAIRRELEPLMIERELACLSV